MSTVNRAAARHSADGTLDMDAVDVETDPVGVYLTDEVFLYRIVGLVASEVDEIVELEDCYWLDVVHVPASHLQARRLRVVKPTLLAA